MSKRFFVWLVIVSIMTITLISGFSLTGRAEDGKDCSGRLIIRSSQFDIEPDNISINLRIGYDQGRPAGRAVGSYELWSQEGYLIAGGELSSLSQGVLQLFPHALTHEDTPHFVHIQVADARDDKAMAGLSEALHDRHALGFGSQPGCEKSPRETDAWYEIDDDTHQAKRLNGRPDQLKSGDMLSKTKAETRSGGPDAFGYTYTDDISYQWIDATSGATVALGDDDFAGPITIGFDFHFYEHAYNELLISSNGVVSFVSGTRSMGGGWLPNRYTPNNIIAPFWDDLNPAAGGAVYYKRFGSAPNRYFVIEWHGVYHYNTSDPQTFEAILYENGNIKFQYKDMNGTYGDGRRATIGIENDHGDIGLTYSSYYDIITNHLAILFTFPTAHHPNPWLRRVPSPAVREPGAMVSHRLQVVNMGLTGADTYNISITSSWPLALYDENGVPLRDTNNDGAIDTGPLAQGEALDIVAKVKIPTNATAGVGDSAPLVVSSSQNAAKQRTTTLNTTVPGSFALVYSQDYAPDKSTDSESYLDLVQPDKRLQKQVTNNGAQATRPGIAMLSNGKFVQVWENSYRNNSNTWVGELHFQITDNQGHIIVPEKTLVDHSSATSYINDSSPSLATMPNGRFVIAWTRFANDVSIYYAVLDNTGHIVRGATRISPADGAYHDWVSVAATHDNRAIIAWQRYANGIADIYYGVIDSNGNINRSAIDLTHNTGDYDDYYPNVVTLSSNRIFLSWACESSSTSYTNLCSTILNSAGGVVKHETPLTNGDNWIYLSDAAQLSNGNIAIAWGQNGSMYAGVLSTALQWTGGPTLIPGAITSVISVAPDPAGFINLSWMDGYMAYLGYASLNNDGSLRSPGAVYRTPPQGNIDMSIRNEASIPLPGGLVLPAPTQTPVLPPDDIYAAHAAINVTIDGVIHAAEWKDAHRYNVQLHGVADQPVYLYLKHDARYLYVAMEDKNVPGDQYGEIGIYFDDEGGTSPRLYDRAWSYSNCNSYPTGEGNYRIGTFNGRKVDWREIISGPNYCPSQSSPSYIQAAVAQTSGRRSYEAKIDLQHSAMRADVANRDIIGMKLYSYDSSGHFTGWWPADSIRYDPSTYGYLHFGADVYLPTFLTGIPQGDAYEPNNSFSQAWGPLNSGQTYHSYMSSNSDTWDFYYFDMPSGHSIELWLQNIPNGANYNLQLFDASHNRVGYSGNTGNANEHIKLNWANSGRYYIAVNRNPNSNFSATHPYSLRVVYR